MRRIIETLRAGNIECSPNERLTLDVNMFEERETVHAVPKNVVYEDPAPDGNRVDVPETAESYFRFFLDGCETFHHVIDASFRGSYLPICAAQVGVAVLERVRNRPYHVLKDERFTRIRRLLLLPRGHLPPEDIRSLTVQINEALPTSCHFDVVEYNPRGNIGADTRQEPEYHARACVLSHLHDMELSAMQALLSEGLISGHDWLALDGGLQFRQSATLEELLRGDVFARNVVALAKTRDPSQTVGSGRQAQSIGNLTRNLDFAERTPAFTTNKHERLVRGFWYLRIRPRRFIYFPQQGMIKLEVFADGMERAEGGLNPARVNGISSCVLRERNVTPFKTDDRWGNHLYPIYTAERYLKSSFLSEMRFKALII